MKLMLDAALRVLQAAGLPAAAAMPGRSAGLVRTAQVAVSLPNVTCCGTPVYLGMTEHNGEPVELYGHRLEAELLAEILTPSAGGADPCARLAERAAEALLAGVEGLRTLQVRTERPVYQPELDCFLARVAAGTAAYAYALPTEDETCFRDFALKATPRSGQNGGTK